MKKKFTSLELDEYNSLLYHIKLAIYQRFKTLREFAAFLGVDEAYLNKVMNGVVACNSRLFFVILSLSGFAVFQVKELPKND